MLYCHRSRIPPLAILFTVLSVTAALAAPARLAQQGRLLSGDGEPLSGTHALVFSIYDAQTGGDEIWREERSVGFEQGYYSVVLGEFVPVDDLLFDSGSVWLELWVDGVVLSPRQELVSVPWALRATSAEHLDGGTVDATEISVAGVPVIDSTGAWIGPTVGVDWSELSGIPADIADGDQDTDTQLSETQVEGYITNAAVDLSSGTTVGGAAIATGAHTTDTDTHLSEGQVDLMVANNNYSTGAHTTDTDTHLSETQVEGYITNGALALSSGTTVGGAAIATGAHTTAYSGPGTVFYTRCAWSVNSYSQIGTCTPPSCPTGWTDLGVNGNVKTESTDYGYHNSAHPESAGYQERTCHSATTYLVATTRCSWSTGTDSSIGSCTPSACSSGWTDLGTTGNVKTAVMGYGYWNSNMTHSAGYQERTCTR